ncbi:MAG: polysaccharide (de)acetylase [Flavobacterium sp.]
MLKKVKRNIARHIGNLPGWKTGRKILVIESDDWGSIRMPNAETYNAMLKLGYPVDIRPFEKYDTLASSSDLTSIFDMLSGIKNNSGQNPVITANTVVANPDFEKIAQSNFENYYYEKFTDTLKRYYPAEDTFGVWKQGIDEKLFFPQFHAREHYNTLVWMRLLRENDKDAITAFQHKMAGIPSKERPELGNQLQIALGITQPSDIEMQKEIVSDGLDIFEEIFGYRSESFIAPVYTWSDNLEKTLAEKGVKYLQGGKLQLIPDPETGIIRTKKHLLGEKNSHGQIYLTRNGYFEPATFSKDWVGQCIAEIDTAFIWRRPAIVSAHRLNFIGGIDPANREIGIAGLREVLKAVTRKHPTVEFMTTTQLGNLIAQKK